MTRWRVTSEAELYRDDWLDIRVADVELPDGNRLRHRIIKTPPYAGVVALGPGRRVLLLWRHRFITDSWGWEIPGGRVERGEHAIDAAAREFREETGWRAAPLRPLLRLQPNNGITDARQEVFRADGATPAGPPSDPSESERVGAARRRPRPHRGRGDRQRDHHGRAPVPDGGARAAARLRIRGDVGAGGRCEARGRCLMQAPATGRADRPR
ncbi:NUDIX hydrolase [Actinomadura sp. NEAU-AAG7]|uniref:NUDIX hydrolase n=1 Tax=Actinomadura sp. NEAU-AAG7 TaxID=2839640 RepID=UPI0027DF31A7|nr:NUDIX hydrolase [Actinomadura sp. NEAU-AAG7]